MSKRYTSGVVSSTSPTVNAAGASGVFTLNQQSAAQSTNNWPPYKVEKSLRFRSAASGYLSRTPASAGNRKTWTWSGWVKRGAISSASSQSLFTTYNGGSNGFAAIRLEPDNTFYVFDWTGSAFVWVLGSSQVFRDPSAWYHIVVAVDTTQATSTNRVKIYINGSQMTAFATSTYPSLNLDTYTNSTQQAAIGSTRTSASNTEYFDGYMAEVNLIDGQALTPSSFGATDKDGNWSPIAYTGSYGTNGFYLNFKDATSTSTVGYDYSGNGNNWASSGISVTAGTTYDSMIDVPSDQSDGTANNRGSYCTFNLLDKDSDITTSDGNLSASTSTVAHNLIRSTIAIPSSGKFYAEMSFNQTMSGNPAAAFALIAPTSSLTDHIVSAGNYSVYGSSATILASGATSGASVTGMTSGQTWQIAVDADNNQAWVGLNNAWYNVYTSGATTGNPSTNTNPTFTGTMAGLFFGADFVNSSGSINFGQRPFAYAPPTGFKALNTFNLPEPTIKQPNQYFDINLWTGNATNRAITNAGGFQPDFVWIKHRSSAENHNLYDGIRGPGNRLESNADAPDYYYSDRITAFNSNGFSLGTGYNNTNGTTYVGWQWRGSSANTTNTSGSITSIVRANQTAGFSIVTYTGTGGTGTTTVGHGLTVSPSMVLIKRRDSSANWASYHTGLTSTSYYLVLNSTAAQGNYGSTFISPGSSTLTIARDSSLLNTNTGTYVAYCFAQVAGYSAFGSYTGNGSTDGPFIFTGFRPRYVLVKRTDTIANWTIRDTARNPYNSANLGLFPNLSAAEDSTSGRDLDILSNGFKIRGTDSDLNTSSGTYIYMAFAETPFKYSRSR